MLKNKLLWSIFLIALLLRVVFLGRLPVGFHVDEVRVGWNAYSIFRTGEDDRGNSLALYYNTFGDYRPAGIFYLTIPSIFLFGLNEFAVRFPSALIGAMTVFPLYLLTGKLIDSTANKKRVGLIASFLLAISPWHIVASRATSEVVISTFFAICGIYFLLKRNALGSVGMFFVSYFFYHSIRLLAPLFVLIMLVHSNQHRSQRIKVFIAISLVTLFLISNTTGRGRFAQVSVFKQEKIAQVLSATDAKVFKTVFDNKYVIYGERFLGEYAQYFSFDFLVGDNVLPKRYSTPHTGLMTYSGFVLLAIGAYTVLKVGANKLVLWLLIAAPLTAALTSEDSPNMHRAFLMLPFITIIIAIAIEKLWASGKTQRGFLYFLIFVELLSLHHFGMSYTTRTAEEVGFVRNISAKNLVVYLNEVKDNYEKVIVTNDPDDPYPWYAFYSKQDPAEFNSYAIKRNGGLWEFQNLVFTQKECPSGDEFPGKFEPPFYRNILVVDGFRCSAESKIKDGMQAKIVKHFYNPDGTIAYTLWGKI